MSTTKWGMPRNHHFSDLANIFTLTFDLDSV